MAPRHMLQSPAGRRQKSAAIICLEGASAAGKTTLSQAIAARTGAAVIAEVWALFERPSPEPPLWYFEKQVERWRLAVERARKHGLSILDGDPFQPLWYGWAYGFIDPHTLTTVTSFYCDDNCGRQPGLPRSLHTSHRRGAGIEGGANRGTRHDRVGTSPNSSTGRGSTRGHGIR
jgi:hypothetical protein